jgi:hypothetical protein
VLKAPIAALLAAVSLVSAQDVLAGRGDPADGPSVTQVRQRLLGDLQLIESSSAELARLLQQPAPAGALEAARQRMAIESTSYRLREAIRSQQRTVYQLATYPDLEQPVLQAVPSTKAGSLADAVAGLRSIWALAGIDEPWLVRIRRGQPYQSALPPETLLGYYRATANRYGLDWTYLASLNFIESAFGRVTGPSSAGALGPMQLLPSSWDAYGEGGDVNNPSDAIPAAARYLVRFGAPGNMVRALFNYNHDYDYVDAVMSYASAMRRDPAWFITFYYWNTYG